MRTFSKKILLATVFCVAVVGLSACTRIDDSEVGVRRTFGGVIKDQELGTGFHQTMVGEVIHFAAKEILLSQDDLTPQSKDKSVLSDFDINFTYTLDSSNTAEYYKTYSTSSHLKPKDHEEFYPMGAVVSTIVRASTYSAVAEFDALEINNKRPQIEVRIIQIANAKLQAEGLAKIRVKMVNVRNISLADDVVASANLVVKSQNDLATKKNEVLIAVQEAERIKALSAQSDDSYVSLLDAQTRKVQADAMLMAAGKGSTIWVVPQGFTALGNVAR